MHSDYIVVRAYIEPHWTMAFCKILYWRPLSMLQFAGTACECSIE